MRTQIKATLYSLISIKPFLSWRKRETSAGNNSIESLIAEDAVALKREQILRRILADLVAAFLLMDCCKVILVLSRKIFESIFVLEIYETFYPDIYGRTMTAR